MSSVWITGDTHGEHQLDRLSSKNFPDGKELTKDDYLIVAGDFGLVFSNNPLDHTERYWTAWLNSKRWTTLFVDGNHENHARLAKLPTKEMFGGTVGIVSDSIFHLRRGEIYTIHNKKFFCFGGATSTDRKDRLEYVDWWKQEVPTENELKYGFNNLSKHEYKVDYLLFHTVPTMIHNRIPHKKSKAYLNDPTCKMLDEIYKRTTFKKGFSGHFHLDYEIDNWSVLYDRVVKIK